MALIDSLKEAFSEYEIKDEKDGISLKRVIAERKAFLSTKKLEYSARVKVNETTKEVVFSEMLKESGSGLSMGTDSDMSSGFGFSAGTYSQGMGGKSGTIQEQSELFGKQFTYTFDYSEVRSKVETVVKNEGYTFKYSIF